MFRRARLPSFPDWYGEVYTYDWVLATLILINGGTAGFIDETMAVYRVHGSNLYSRLDERTRLEKELRYYDYLLPLIPERALASARLGKADRLYDLANNYRRTGDKAQAKALFSEALSLESEGHRLPWRRKARMKVRLGLGL
jgi:tetratricopeptide (TPR) repeat protein